MSKKKSAKKPAKKAAKKVALVDVSDVVDKSDWILTYTHQKCTLDDLQFALKTWSKEVGTLMRRHGKGMPIEKLTWDGVYRKRYKD